MEKQMIIKQFFLHAKVQENLISIGLIVKIEVT
jgi:hypothetical protein